MKFLNDNHDLKSGRQVAARCWNATRRRSSSVKMAAPLATCTKEEQIRNTARLFCKYDNSDTDGLKIGRQVAVRCRNATRLRSSGVKMAAPLATCTKAEQRSVFHFLSSEVVKPTEIHRPMTVQYVDACLSLQQVYRCTRQFMNGISSVTDCPRPSQAHPVVTTEGIVAVEAIVREYFRVTANGTQRRLH
jgi:hypothetical protein